MLKDPIYSANVKAIIGLFQFCDNCTRLEMLKQKLCSSENRFNNHLLCLFSSSNGLLLQVVSPTKQTKTPNPTNLYKLYDQPRQLTNIY